MSFKGRNRVLRVPLFRVFLLCGRSFLTSMMLTLWQPGGACFSVLLPGVESGIQVGAETGRGGNIQEALR